MKVAVVTKAVWLAAILLVIAMPCAALDPQKRITQYVRTTWSVEQGLPAYGITAIVQDSDGYLWTGTSHGLARFDGVRFTKFDRRSTPALMGNDITALVADPAGGIWIGMLGGGIARYHEGRLISLREADGLAGDRVLTLAFTPDGDLWTGGYGGVTQIREGKVVRRYRVADGLSADPVSALYSDPAGPLWIASLGGLNQLLDGELKAFSRTDGLPDLALRDLYRFRDGKLILRSMVGGLARQTATGFESWKIPGIPPDTAVRSLLEDREGSVWVGTDRFGIYRISAGKVEHISTAQGLPSERVRTLIEDRDGNIWVGSPEGGLYRFRDGVFSTWGRAEGVASDVTFPVYEDDAGTVWVGSNGGLARLSGDTVRNYTTADGLSSDFVRALYGSRIPGAVWVGTHDAGVNLLQNHRVVRSLHHGNGLPSNRVNALLEDGAGTLWIATAGGGLARHADGKTTVLTRADGLADDFVFALKEARDGVLWVATANGLSSVRNDRISDDARGLALSGLVLALYEDARGVLWIGTDGQGLQRLERGQLTGYGDIGGFPDDTIYAILEDGQARFWMSSYRGVFAVERAQLDAIAAGARQPIEATLYGIADGLRSTECNGGVQPAGWRGRDGRLWFPTMSGVSVIDPEKTGLAGSAPMTRIEALFADDQPIALTPPVRLPAGTRRLAIHYGAPSLSAPERTRYHVALDGFDPHWNEIGLQRAAHFTNLGPGDYRFRVAATDTDGHWGEPASTLVFSIAPRYFQTWWFTLLVVLLLTGLLWSAYYLRLAWLKSQNAVLRERQRIAGEIHDNLSQALSGIFYQTETARRRLLRDPDAAERHLQAVSELAAQGSEAARRSVWELEARSHASGGLVAAIDSAALALVQGREMTAHVHVSGLEWYVPPQIEHHLLRIAQSAMGNAVEHASCREIRVELAYARDALTLQIRDDGAGFDVHAAGQHPGRGFGLANMRHRAEQMRARIEIDSTSGAGTSVRVTLLRRRWIWHLQRSMGAAFRGASDDAIATEGQDPAG